MATIPVQATELRHVRKTITFTGGAGAGAVGTVTVFTITGRVLVTGFTGFCTTTLTEAGATATISIGVTSASNIFAAASDSVNLIADDWVYLSSPGFGYDMAQNGDFSNRLAISENVIINCAVNATNGGVIVCDIWYFPITDNGALAGDDIDEPLRDHIWAKALSDLAAVPAATASALAGLNWLFTLGRNRRKQTATTETVYKDDATTAVATSTKSDDGTTFERSEYS